MVIKFFWELIKTFLIAMAIIIPIRYFLVQPFFVRGASMEPTFQDGEYLLIDQLSYRFREPGRGEVVVFRYPLDPSQFFIKRIVGVPGDTVRVTDGAVQVSNQQLADGAILNESTYLPNGLRTGGQAEVTLGEGEFFVLGDNRPASSDSRSWGVLQEEDVVGRVWIRAFPFNTFSVFEFEPPGFISVTG